MAITAWSANVSSSAICGSRTADLRDDRRPIASLLHGAGHDRRWHDASKRAAWEAYGLRRRRRCRRRYRVQTDVIWSNCVASAARPRSPTTCPATSSEAADLSHLVPDQLLRHRRHRTARAAAVSHSGRLEHRRRRAMTRSTSAVASCSQRLGDARPVALVRGGGRPGRAGPRAPADGLAVRGSGCSARDRPDRRRSRVLGQSRGPLVGSGRRPPSRASILAIRRGNSIGLVS